jgi:Sap, sulfolipid-1-addressing protein
LGAVIGDILGIAVGVAISPIPIIAMVLILSSTRAKGNGLAFGWGGCSVSGWWAPSCSSSPTRPALPPTKGRRRGSAGSYSHWEYWPSSSGRQWASRPAPGVTPEMPKWMQAIDGFTSGKSFGIGFLFAAVNPKNTILTLAAAAAIAAAGLSTANSFVVLAIFVLIGSLGLLIPLLVYLFAGERAAHFLDGLQQWMGAHNAAVMAVLFWVIGAKIVGNGLGILLG